ncbi:type III effector protein [Streptomyces sp. CHD11]|uniref:type III effector protein n=1 Tax=Streptomyces sp. CHD11 TaxID=2741325 RepID=UPI001BFC1B49|nr:type III effector protein [Streptomyces sp. CHD11]MBT3150390.1 type III effector protein [Streptomyces sp. CHD11]
MTADAQKAGARPASFLAAEAALAAIDEAVHTAQAAQAAQSGRWPGDDVSSDQALAALLLLRRIRAHLAGWETGLIETARDAGASWADLAQPLGVASRQAAERRYLRLRPGAPGTTGEQRVQATRDRRAGDRAVTAWARGNAGDLRQLAGQITALTGLPAEARTPLLQALGRDDAAGLIGPLARARDHLAVDQSELITRIDTLTRHTDRIRASGNVERRPPG